MNAKRMADVVSNFRERQKRKVYLEFCNIWFRVAHEWKRKNGDEDGCAPAALQPQRQRRERPLGWASEGRVGGGEGVGATGRLGQNVRACGPDSAAALSTGRAGSEVQQL